MAQADGLQVGMMPIYSASCLRGLASLLTKDITLVTDNKDITLVIELEFSLSIHPLMKITMHWLASLGDSLFGINVPFGSSFRRIL